MYRVSCFKRGSSLFLLIYSASQIYRLNILHIAVFHNLFYGTLCLLRYTGMSYHKKKKRDKKRKFRVEQIFLTSQNIRTSQDDMILKDFEAPVTWESSAKMAALQMVPTRSGSLPMSICFCPTEKGSCGAWNVKMRPNTTWAIKAMEYLRVARPLAGIPPYRIWYGH